MSGGLRMLNEMFFAPACLRITMPVILLLSVGFLVVMSASSEYSQAYHGISFYFLIKQGGLTLIGLLLLLTVLVIPLEFWRARSATLLLLNLLLLLILFMPIFGKEVNHSTRWLSLGVFNLQPSELLKVSVPLFFAQYLSQNINGNSNVVSKLLVLLGVIACIDVLVLLQPDFATAVIYTFVGVVLIFFAGLRMRYLLFAGLALMATAFALVAVQPYRLNRFACLVDANIWERFYEQCYQVGNSLVAIERGGLWGLGLGSSIQKNFYLPEAYTDFVFAIIVEELGLVFGVLLICLFAFLIYALLKLALDALQKGDTFSAYFCSGVAIVWGLQFVCNIGVSLSLLPVTGLTLPFISYGGSSLMTNLILVGIIVKISHQVYEDDYDEQQSLAVAGGNR
ncbi:MAG: FtsW/RodA/SpoVE family cell cycle protein [Gammaproteobacteria bacterium]|nr:FtsW/RodA/SpoVE family cell cycle protein [Gammaproteobacteria bacterium]